MLFQLPPRLAYEPERLTRILAALAPAFVNVLEFRHPSWWREEVFEALRRRQVVFCGQSHPPLPAAVVATAPTRHYRFHGGPQRYAFAYTDEFLQQKAAELLAAPGVAQGYLYFHNVIGAAAIGNARTRRALLGA